MNRMKLAVAAIALFSAAGAALAEPAGNAFTYQGKLGHSGNSANGSYDFQYKLFSAATGGYQIGSTVLAPATPVQGGIFNATIDFGPFAFNGDAAWLEIDVRPAGNGSYTTLAPRQRLTPAPYASSLALPYATTAATSSPMIQLTQSGEGSAGSFQVITAANSAPALKAYTFGTGVAADLIVSNAQSQSPVVRAVTNGMGHAGEFRTTNAGSVKAALRAESNNMGPAVNGLNSSIGRAGYFQNTSTSFSGDTVKMENTGPGSVLGISSPQGQGAWISLPASNASKAMHITHAGTGDGVVISKSNATNTGRALVVQGQTPTATAIEVSKGIIKRVHAPGAAPAMTTPVAFASFAGHNGYLYSSSGNVTTEPIVSSSSSVNKRIRVTVTGDPFTEEWVVVATETYGIMPQNTYRVLTTEPDEFGRFQIDVKCMTCSSSAYNIMEPTINLVIYRP
jgi:hypothetical protein